MKKIYVFAYCDGVLTPDVIFYDVKVGISKVDKAAFAYVSGLKDTHKFFLALRSNSVQQFIEQCALSLFPSGDLVTAVSCLRRKVVTVTWLAKFLRTCPLALLNSKKIDCADKKGLQRQ